MRPRGEVDPGADGLDDPRALVAEDGRAARLGRPVDRVEVRVADPAGVDAHERLAGAGRGELEIGEFERRPGVLEDGRADPQDAPPPGAPAPAPSSAGAAPFRRAGGAVRCISRSASTEWWQRQWWPGSTSRSS